MNEVELDIKKNVEAISNLYQDKLDGVVGVETYKTLSIKYENRICELNDLYNEWADNANHERPAGLCEVDFATYYEGEELWEQLQKILAAGGEGIVMTKKGTVPSPGKRTARKTLKVKKELAELKVEAKKLDEQKSKEKVKVNIAPVQNNKKAKSKSSR